MSDFFAPGKLLLSGEYSVLQGAKAIAVPTKMGQHLKASPNSKDDLHYAALDDKGLPWLNFLLSEAKSSEECLVRDILLSASKLSDLIGWSLETKLDFPREWGLGSSSTFIALIAEWSQKDVWPLFFNFLKGSGYDVAVALAKTAIEYQLSDAKKPQWKSVQIPDFFAETGLMYLGKKQNSAREVSRYLASDHPAKLVQEISQLSEDLLKLNDVQELETWMEEHERKTASLIGKPTIEESFRPIIEGKIKSLGAWGGDFVWLSRLDSADKLRTAGFNHIYTFKELVDH